MSDLRSNLAQLSDEISDAVIKFQRVTDNEFIPNVDIQFIETQAISESKRTFLFSQVKASVVIEG